MRGKGSDELATCRRKEGRGERPENNTRRAVAVEDGLSYVGCSDGDVLRDGWHVAGRSVSCVLE